MYKSLMSAMFFCFVSACKISHQSQMVEPITGTKEKNTNSNETDNQKLAVAIAYGVELASKNEFKIKKGQLTRIPQSSNGIDPYCEVEAEAFDAILYPEEKYNLFEIAGEDFSGVSGFSVEISGRDRVVGKMRCYNIPKNAKSEYTFASLQQIVNDVFVLSLRSE